MHAPTSSALLPRGMRGKVLLEISTKGKGRPTQNALVTRQVLDSLVEGLNSLLMTYCYLIPNGVTAFREKTFRRSRGLCCILCCLIG